MEGKDTESQSGVLFKDSLVASKADAASQDVLVDVIVDVLEWDCAMNDGELAGRPTRVTVFHGQNSPGVSVRAYLERINCFSGCSSCCFVLGALYLEQLRGLDSAYKLNSYNFHRLCLTAIMVAAKFVDDFYFSNNYWAKVGGIPNDELNGLELEFLFLVNFNMHVKREDYDLFVKELKRRQKHVREKQATKTMNVLNVPTSQVSVRS
mmetsp:Transcript_54568/g.111357  ORF Transcript_54568/g.111357 Transcript_54568/m.111357 type:complete len:208 (-) Transcript_54568:38-661(-)